MANTPNTVGNPDTSDDGAITEDGRGIDASSGNSGSGSNGSRSGNSGSGSGAGSQPDPTGTRKHRRTRAEIEASENVAVLTPAGPAPGSSKPLRKATQKGLSEIELAMATSGLFNLVASVRGDHWSKSPDECMVFARPASQWMESVTPAVAKQLQAVFLPLSTIMGLGCLLVTPLSAEKSLLSVKTNRQPSRYDDVSKGGSPGAPGNRNPEASTNASGPGGIRDKRHPDELARPGPDPDTF